MELVVVAEAYRSGLTRREKRVNGNPSLLEGEEETNPVHVSRVEQVVGVGIDCADVRQLPHALGPDTEPKGEVIGGETGRALPWGTLEIASGHGDILREKANRHAGLTEISKLGRTAS
jgi:hypothetical protein